MRYGQWLLCIAGCLIGIGCGRTDGTDSDNQIIPGERVGPFLLNRTEQATVLGKNSPEELRQKYAKMGLYFTFEQEEELTSVTVLNPNFQTDKGIKVGDEPARVVEQYGQPKENSLKSAQGKSDMPAMVYDGIMFLLEKDKVAAITVIPTPPPKKP